MGLIREPKGVDFIIKSEPWTEQDLADFRVVMNKMKAKGVERKVAVSSGKAKAKQRVKPTE